MQVTDTGPGISAEDLSRIFEAFQQVDHTSTRHKGGSEQGLANPCRIVEMHGGRLSVRRNGSTEPRSLSELSTKHEQIGHLFRNFTV